MARVLHVSLWAGDHAALYRPLAGIRVSLHVRSQQRRADRPRRLPDRVRR